MAHVIFPFPNKVNGERMTTKEIPSQDIAQITDPKISLLTI